MEHIAAIGLMVDTRTALGRGIAQGVTEYVNGVKDGRLVIQLPIELRELGSLKQWPIAGIIMLVHSRELTRIAHGLGVPVINVSVSQAPEEVGLPTVCPDNRVLGRLAAEYFIERGFEHFAFLGEITRYFSRVRREGYCAALLAAGFTPHLMESGLHEDAFRLGPSAATTKHKSLFEWLLGLPKPVALLTGNDLWGADAVWACGQVGLSVPELVSVMGVDDEPWVNRLVPLSSVPQPGVKVGYEAAALLDRICAGEAPPQGPLLIEPTDSPVTRHSTDALPIRDPDIARALRYIRHHATERPMSIDDVLEQVALTRRTFERRFRVAMDCSPQEEIQRVRLERAKDLLAKTDLPVPDVADAAGFGNVNRFGIAFKSYTGVTPIKYRRQFRPARKPQGQ
jgi:LacI family transcriptional regulator